MLKYYLERNENFCWMLEAKSASPLSTKFLKHFRRHLSTRKLLSTENVSTIDLGNKFKLFRHLKQIFNFWSKSVTFEQKKIANIEGICKKVSSVKQQQIWLNLLPQARALSRCSDSFILVHVSKESCDAKRRAYIVERGFVSRLRKTVIESQGNSVLFVLMTKKRFVVFNTRNDKASLFWQMQGIRSRVSIPCQIKLDQNFYWYSQTWANDHLWITTTCQQRPQI